MSAPACWGWKQCPETRDAYLCACMIEAKRPGRRPTFGDFQGAAPLTKEEREQVARTCANFRTASGAR